VSERVAAVVVARERVASLEAMFAALGAQTRPPDELVVVDSDATPEVRALLQRVEAPRASIVRLGENGGSAGGFAAGMNAVARDGRSTLAWTLDDDAIPARNCLELLLRAYERLPDAGAVGALSCDPDGTLAWPLNLADGARRVHTADEVEAAAKGGSAVGVCELAWHALLVPVPVIQRLGGPSRELFMWYEDVEYGMRLRHSGLLVYVVPGARVTHPPPRRLVSLKLLGVPFDVPIAGAAKSYLMIRNSLVVHHRYGGVRFWYADLPLLLVRGGIAVFSERGARIRGARVLARAVLDAARGRMGPPPVSLSR
jgi:rhamnopyranosyl-N-acetylglucosaminyl-diphospho-decaprenol beta-1,3/1,4-galactofuranosyltransferase